MITLRPRWAPWLRFFAAMAFALAALAAVAQAPAWEAGTDGLRPVPALKARVTDLTGTLAAGEAQALDAKLAAWEQKTGNQLAVLIVPTTQPEPIEAYSIRVADAWKIGRKGQDNGALLVVAKDDRKLRIEVGYGFEGSLTDATSRRIIAETIAPAFRQNRYAQGINAGVDQIIDVVDKGEPLAARPPRQVRRRAASAASTWRCCSSWCSSWCPSWAACCAASSARRSVPRSGRESSARPRGSSRRRCPSPSSPRSSRSS